MLCDWVCDAFVALVVSGGGGDEQILYWSELVMFVVW